MNIQPILTYVVSKLGEGDILSRLRRFNQFAEDMLIELSRPLLLACFILATISLFTRGTLADSPPFQVLWATAQAIAIDGLFFAVWSRVRRADWTKQHVGKNASLIAVGLLLGMVAMSVNDILTYQDLTSVTDVLSVLRTMRIDVVSYSHIRSVLVVLSVMLVSVFCRDEKTSLTSEKESRIVSQPEKSVSQPEKPVSQSENNIITIDDVMRQEGVSQATAYRRLKKSSSS